MAKKELITEDDDLPQESQEEELVIIEEEPESKDRQRDQEDEEDDDDDERVVTSKEEDNDAEREEIRERRRREKQERRERREKAITRDKIELDFLRKRNDDLERRLTAQEQRSHQSDLNGYDAQIAQASREIEMAERVIAKAVEAGNGEDVAQAMRYRDQAFQKLQHFNAVKQQAAAQSQTKPQGLDELTLSHAKAFMEENDWYDPQGRNEDSAIVIAIDQTLAKEGYDPRTEEYWDELRDRAARRLPERFSAKEKEEPAQRKPRGGPPVGSGKEHAPQSSRKEIYISAERKQALIDAGVWDDPVLRAKYVKRYAEYDKQNRA